MERQKQKIDKEIEIRSAELGVFDETGELKKVMMWGMPGAETVLGQLLPRSISCFEKAFDVPKARKELSGAMDIIKSGGVNVFVVKDEWAKMIQEQGIRAEQTIDELKQELIERGNHLYDKYKVEREKENAQEKLEASKDGTIYEQPNGLEVLNLLDDVLAADVEKYGENAAVIMNRKLCLEGYLRQDGERLPLSNIFYARDQSNLIGTTWIWSSMKHDIRKAEVDIYKEVVRHSGLLDKQEITEVEVEENNGLGFFEGGDGIPTGGIALIGVGGRTDWEGVKQVAKPILNSGLRLMVVRDSERTKDKLGEMDAMHLDTFFMPTNENEAVACPDETVRRKVFEIVLDDNCESGFNVVCHGSFQADLDSGKVNLDSQNVELVPITKEEQLAYAPNFLNLDSDSVILSRADSNNLTKELTLRGKEVVSADFQEVTKGFGGLHCATASIHRV